MKKSSHESGQAWLLPPVSTLLIVNNQSETLSTLRGSIEQQLPHCMVFNDTSAAEGLNIAAEKNLYSI